MYFHNSRSASRTEIRDHESGLQNRPSQTNLPPPERPPLFPLHALYAYPTHPYTTVHRPTAPAAAARHVHTVPGKSLPSLVRLPASPPDRARPQRSAYNDPQSHELLPDPDSRYSASDFPTMRVPLTYLHDNQNNSSCFSFLLSDDQKCMSHYFSKPSPVCPSNFVVCLQINFRFLPIRIKSGRITAGWQTAHLYGKTANAAGKSSHIRCFSVNSKI